MATEDVFPRQMIYYVVGICALFAIVLVPAYLYPRYRTLARCDAAVQSRLKAPATYVRITPTIWTLESGSTIAMSYDAKNSFGMPIRGYGSCLLNYDGTSADWRDKLDLQMAPY